MQDQYGSEVPKDLVVIDFGLAPETLVNFTREAEEVVLVLHKPDWYEVAGQEGLVLVSAEAIDYLCETDPLDCGFPANWKNLPTNRIADALKRWSPEDGFYHA